MKQRAGEPQTNEIPVVHRYLESIDGRGTTGNAILLGRTSRIPSLKP